MEANLNIKKMLLAAALFSFSLGASASTVNPSGMTVSLSKGESVNFTQTSLDSATSNVFDSVAGYDRWQIILNSPLTDLLVNFVTAQSNSSPPQYLDHATLSDSTFTNSWTQTAVTGIPFTGSSSILLNVSNLAQGTYYLDIYGPAGLGYSTTVSAVPLPGAALLFGSVLLGAGALRRKQAKAGEMAAA